MRYCVNCGQELREGASFCANCGIRVQENSPESGTVAADIQVISPQFYQMEYSNTVQNRIEAYRVSNIQKITDIFNYFSVKREDFKRKYELEEMIVPRLSRRSVAPLVWGIIVTIIGLLLTGIFVFMLCFAKAKLTSVSDVVTVFGMPGAILLLGALLLTIYVQKGKHSKKKLEVSQAELQELNNELYQYYNQSGYINLIGFEYVDPVVLETIMQIIVSGRANTISEAIQQFVSDIRNDQLQSYSKEILRQIQSVRRWAKAGVGLSAANLGVGIMRWVL